MSTGSAPCAGSAARPAGGRASSRGLTTLVDLATGAVIDVVDGRDSAAVGTSLGPNHGGGGAGSRWWRSTRRQRSVPQYVGGY